MKEPTLRSWHRKAGIVVALFILLQALTGIVLTVEDLMGVYWGGIVHDLHKRYSTAGDIYRLISGMGMLFMVVTGSWIGLKIRQRQNKAGR